MSIKTLNANQSELVANEEIVSDTNALPVKIVSGGGGGGGSGTEYVEDAVAPANPTGGIVMAVRKDTLSASEVSADGDVIALKSTNKGQLHVLAEISGGGTGGGDASAANQATIIGHVDGIETLLGTTNTLTTSQNTLIGSVTETAPATDTASSGLNGRLQRIAQRVTALIALVPASLGQKTKTASFAVTIASDDDIQTKLTDIKNAVNPTSTAAVTGTIVSTGVSSTFTPAATKPFNLVLSGTWEGSVIVERQFGGAGSWFPCTYIGDTVTFTTNVSEVLEENEASVNYRLTFTRTSGTLSYRFSQ